MENQLLTHYSTASDSYDEMLDAAKVPRAHWRAILTNLAAEAPEIMNNRVETVRRQMLENGVTYNVYTDIKGIQRPWDLNVLPLVLPDNEWVEIEAGVIQRATLLNAILIDIYGEQRILKEGLIPPALIHGHAGFLRSCHGKQHHDNIALHFYALDLARAPSGRWWVVNDKIQAPSGAGYALENRSVMARTFPDLLRDLNINYLTEFFNTMLESLTHWGRQCAAESGAPLRNSEPPLIVLLTPGPYNETYFEQAYLARHLGVPLVEGNDLTVRNGFVWFKSLSGMQRVHVIMRRVDDDFCDPLELRADSALGVAGLTQAARLGNVVIANSLGSNILESGAMLGFLPKLCERFLGEPLKIPSVATWWCGEPAALSSVITNLDKLVIKPSFPQLRQLSVFGQDLKGAHRDAFIQSMHANPNNFVAQELVKLSQAPVWQSGGSDNPGSLAACSIGLRVFACATPSGYVVMPGGLTRVATGPDARVITMQRGGGSKDTWVQANKRLNHRQAILLKRTITANELIRDDTHLSSRMAENLFWFGRYAERCDSTARLLRVALMFLSNVSPTERASEWEAIKALCAWVDLIDTKDTTEPSAKRMTDTEIESALLEAVVSPDVPGLAKQQQQLHNIAGNLSERLSFDNWRMLNQMIQHKYDKDQLLSQSEAMSVLDNVTASLMTLSGFALDGMTRDLGWRFLSLGRRIERLQFQSVALQNALKMDANSNLNWLLELSDSIITYRARYRSTPEWLPVLDLLILDETNPRSIVFQIEGIQKSLGKIARTYGTFAGEDLAPFQTELLELNLENDLYCGNARLISLATRIGVASTKISEQISVQFFSYTSGRSR